MLPPLPQPAGPRAAQPRYRQRHRQRHRPRRACACSAPPARLRPERLRAPGPPLEPAHRPFPRGSGREGRSSRPVSAEDGAPVPPLGDVGALTGSSAGGVPRLSPHLSPSLCFQQLPPSSRTFCPSPKSPWLLSVAPFSPSRSSPRGRWQPRAATPTPRGQCPNSRGSDISAPVAMPVAACALLHGDSNHLPSPCLWPRSKSRPSASVFHILSAKWG